MDPKLLRLLEKKLKITDKDTIDKLASEGITHEDFDYISNNDLKRLGLKVGPEIRIWNYISKCSKCRRNT